MAELRQLFLLLGIEGGGPVGGRQRPGEAAQEVPQSSGRGMRDAGEWLSVSGPGEP